MPRAAATHYRQDPLYARITSATKDVRRRGPAVTPVDVLIAMGLLTRQQLEDWRRGRIPYLERVINCNLPRLARVLRILRFHAEELGLKPSFTAYMRWGRGPKTRLRFTKSGDPNVEEAYATHFVGRSTAPVHRPESEAGASAPGATDRLSGALEAERREAPGAVEPAVPPTRDDLPGGGRV